MPSLIPGYEYDIFISYRQKDNKGDKWVSKFVDALKTELEATFKEDVSVYFDENPHDRLQETHNVDKSLEGKLKCLIFIPILSQTYCDPSSYAWKHEMLSFLKMAEKDQFGKDVKLRSGNVASRILPIRIHDLEPEDIKLFEKETGSVLRSLDFIFRTDTGVSRPLKNNEDHPHDNLNKTFYGDQVNRVGHAIKEIIVGIRNESVTVKKETDGNIEVSKEAVGNRSTSQNQRSLANLRKKIIPTAAVAILLILAAYLVYQKFPGRDDLKKFRTNDGKISLVVMPFQNMTGDTTKNIWQSWIQDILIGSLTNTGELIVRQMESVKSILQGAGQSSYASLTPSVGSNIAKKLDANVFINGTIMLTGSKIRISAMLVDARTEEVIKYFKVQSVSSENNILSSIDSLSTQVSDFLLISNQVKKNLDFLPFTNTAYPEAYKYYNSGQYAFSLTNYPLAIDMLSEALEIDTNFIWAKMLLAEAYGNQYWFTGDMTFWKKGDELVQQMYNKRENFPLFLRTYSSFQNAYNHETPKEQIKYLAELLQIDDRLPILYWQMGSAYVQIEQYENAIPLFKKALAIYDSWDIKPWWIANYVDLGEAYHLTGQYKKEKLLYRKAEIDFAENPRLISRQAILALSEGDTENAEEFIERYKSIRKKDSSKDASIYRGVADIYAGAKIADKAEEYYRLALSLDPQNRSRTYHLANFQIKNNTNIPECLNLLEPLVEKFPNDWMITSAYGRALFLSGEYQKALLYLQTSWNNKPIYYHDLYLYLEAAKKAVAGLKQ